jgi:hypothetical protein
MQLSEQRICAVKRRGFTVIRRTHQRSVDRQPARVTAALVPG